MDNIAECNDSACCKDEMPGKIAKKFAYHTPGDDALVRITKIREAFSCIEATIFDTCPQSYQRDAGLTFLETACMWVIKSVVSNDENSVPQI